MAEALRFEARDQFRARKLECSILYIADDWDRGRHNSGQDDCLNTVVVWTPVSIRRAMPEREENKSWHGAQLQKVELGAAATLVVVQGEGLTTATTSIIVPWRAKWDQWHI